MKIHEFQGQIYEGRWGTIVFSIPQLASIQIVMQRFFSLDSMVQSLASSEETARKHLDAVSKFVHSEFTWAYLTMLEHLAKWMRPTLAYLESCDCHFDLLKSRWIKGISEQMPELVNRWRPCPCKGFRMHRL